MDYCSDYSYYVFKIKSIKFLNPVKYSTTNYLLGWVSSDIVKIKLFKHSIQILSSLYSISNLKYFSIIGLYDNFYFYIGLIVTLNGTVLSLGLVYLN